MKKSILLFIAFIFTSTSFADFGVYPLPVTRDGKTTTRVAYNMWSGEYPYPVPVVTQQTTIAGYKSLRELNEKMACTIDKGIYHPWSENTGSLINFYTLSNFISATFMGDQLEGEFYNEDVTTGHGGAISPEHTNIVANIYYGSEGYCGGELIDSNGDRTNVSFSCGVVLDNPDFFIFTESKTFDWSEQWLYVSCAQGYKVFVQDEDLMKMPYVEEGTILGYGTVSAK